MARMAMFLALRSVSFGFRIDDKLRYSDMTFL